MESFTQETALYNFFYAIFRRKRLIGSIFLLTLFLVIFGTFLITPTWQATTLILVEANPKRQLSAFPRATSPAPPTPPVVQAQNLVLLLTGKNMAYEMVKTFNLDQFIRKKVTEPEALRDKIKMAIVNILRSPITVLQKMGLLGVAEIEWVDRAAEDFTSWIDVSVASGTQVIDLTVNGETPELAMNIANAMEKRLREKTFMFSTREANQVYALYQKEVLKTDEKLKAAEEELRKYKEDNKLIALAEETSIKISMLENLKKTYLDAQSEREVKLASLLNEKTQSHPDVIALKTEIGQLKNKLKKETTRLEKELLLIPKQQMQLARLTQEANRYQELKLALQAKGEELRILSQSSVGEISLKVIDKAYISPNQDKDWPSWAINMLIGLFLSFVLSLGSAFFVEYWRDPLRGRYKVERSTGVSVLGAIPVIKE